MLVTPRLVSLRGKFQNYSRRASLPFLYIESPPPPGLDPLTLKSDQYLNSPYNFNMLSSGQVMRIKKIISTKGYCLDITPNSQD